MKKLISGLVSFLLIIMTISSLAIPISAGYYPGDPILGDYSYLLFDADNAEISGYNGTATNLVIPDVLDIPGVGIYTVKSIGKEAFSGNTTISSISLPSGLDNIGDLAFFGCTTLQSVTIPNNVLAVGDYAFQGCTALTTVDIGIGAGDVYWGITPFKDCSSLASINVAPGNINIASLAGVLFTKDMTTLIKYPSAAISISYTIPNVNIIDAYAFAGSRFLQTVTIPSTVNTFRLSAFSDASLTSVNVPDSVTSISDNTFMNCTVLQTAIVGNGITTTGINMFFGCASLTSVTFHSVSKLATIGSGAFEECRVLNNVNIPNSVINISDSAFYNCIGISSLIFGSGLKTIGNYSFTNCIGLTSLNLPSGLLTIGAHSFENCNKIASLIIPNSVTTISEYSFSQCSLLQTISIGIGVNSIGYKAFEACTSLMGITVASGNTIYSSQSGVLFNKAMTILVRYPIAKTGGYSIPSGVTEIADSAFSYSTNLANVYIPNTLTRINSYAFVGSTLLTNVTFGTGINLISDYAFDYCTNLSSVFFLGNAPTVQNSVFSHTTAPVTAYYANGATGYTNPWYGMNTFSAIGASPTTPTTGSVLVTINYPNDAVAKQYMIGAGPWLNYTGQLTITSNKTISARLTDPLANIVPLGSLVISNITRALISITVTTPPAKTNYVVGQSFDPAGMVVSGTFNDSSTEILVNYTYTPTLTLGQTFLTVSYMGFDATTPITVVEKAVTGIALKTTPAKTTYLIGRITYLVGEDLDLTGGVITLSYNDDSSTDVSITDPNVTISGYNKDLQTIGASTQTITVNYVGLVVGATFNVRVLLLGDVNNNGTITAIDALQTLQASTGKIILTAEQVLAADVNRNSTVTAIDALKILQKSTGKIIIL